MWYKSRPSMRRNISVMLLAILAAQLLGGMVFASICLEPCPDDTETASCPPVCSLCTSCTHAQTAIVRSTATSAPAPSAHRLVPKQPASTPSQLASDVFHVPLLG